MITKEQIEKEATELYFKIPSHALRDDTYDKCLAVVIDKYMKAIMGSLDETKVGVAYGKF